MDKCNKKRIKCGFTLVELLAVIVVLGLILGIISYAIGNIFGNVLSKIDDTTKNIILDAAEEYVLEYRNKGDWKENVANNGDVSFCVSLKSLLETGYYDYDDEFVVDNVDELFVSVLINSNKVSKYVLIEKKDVEEKCNYSLSKSEIDKYKEEIDIKDDSDNSLGSLEYQIDKIDNTYATDIDFSVFLNEGLMSINAPVYVAIVLDNSGSMVGSAWNNAMSAAINLSKTVIDKLNGSQVALIQYNDGPMLVRNFQNKALTNSSFLLPTGGTNVSGGLDLAASLFKELGEIPDYAMLYTIILYDGEPTYYSYLQKMNSSSIIYNSSTQLYYDNFYTAFTGANESYNHLYKISSSISRCSQCYNYIINAANYLKGENINSKLITVGYNFSSSDSYDKQLKEASSIDSNFCSNSDYKINVEEEIDVGLDVDMKTQQITYPFTYSDTEKTLTSFDSLNSLSETYGYFEIDLTKYSSTDEIEIGIDYTKTGSNSLIIFASDSDERYYAAFDYINSNSGVIYASANGRNVKKLSVYGGKKYYLHLSIVKKYSGSIVINDVFYSKVSSDLMYDSNVDGYNKNSLISLFTEEESRVVYDTYVSDSSLILSGKKKKSLSGAYEVIDLSDEDGTYILTVNASINFSYGMGVISVSNNEMLPYIPTTYYPIGSVSRWNFYAENNALVSACNQENLRCIFGDTDASDFTFKLDGGNVYYVHFVNDGGYYNNSDGKFIINSLSLLKLGEEIDSVVDEKFQTITSDGCINDELGVVGCLNDTSIHLRNFELNHDGVSIISDNKEIGKSCSHSYSEIDLSSYSSSDSFVVSFSSIINSYSYSYSYGSSDYGNIIITNSPNAPTLVGSSSFQYGCNINDSSNKCVAVASGNYSRKYYTKLQGGEKYYVHFMYCKNNATVTQYADYFSINDIRVYKGVNGISTKFPVDTSAEFSDIVNHIDYPFEEKDGSLVSTNKGVGNSISYRRMKIDLSSYSSDDRFLLEIDDYCSHKDTSKIILDTSNVLPEYNVYSSAYLIHISKTSCNEENNYKEYIYGGKVYYLHFLYAKDNNNDEDENDDLYRVDSIKLSKNVGDSVSLDLSSIKSMNNYSFVKKEVDGQTVYVSTHPGVYNSSYSYFEVDLTSYSSDRNFFLYIDRSTEGYGGYRIYPTTSLDIPEKISANYVGIFNLMMGSSLKYLELTGGKKYYVHINSYSGSKEGKVTLSSIKLKEVVVNTTDNYCYYDSDSDSVGSLFDSISNQIEISASKYIADEAIIELIPGDYFKILYADKTGEVSADDLKKQISLKEYNDDKFNLNQKYVFVLNNIENLVCEEDDGCEIELSLFNLSVSLKNDEGLNKELKIDGPKVKIKYNNGKAIN